MMRTIPLANHVMEMTNRFKVSIVAGVASAALAVAMVPAMAFAADSTTSAQTNLKYQVTGGYEWSVPSDIDFGSDKGAGATSEVVANDDSGATQKVKVTKNVIPAGQKLVISADNSNNFKVTSAEGASLGYAVKAGSNSITEGANVLSVNAGANTADQSLTFTLTTASGANVAEQAGNYTGTMTFASSVEAQ